MILPLPDAKKRMGNSSLFLFGTASLLFLFSCVLGGFWENSFHYHVTLTGMGIPFTLPGGGFILLYGISFFLFSMLFLLFPKGLKRSHGIWLILSLSLLFRLPLLFHPPSDDLNRYLWEGKVMTSGVNPYETPPNHPQLKRSAEKDPFHRNINHPGLTAAYPPLVLFLFSLIGHFFYTPLAIKCVILLFDLGTISAVLIYLNARVLEIRWSLLYAFNPLILYAFSAQGHFDVIQNFFLSLSLLWYEKKWWKGMFFFLGTAVGIKYVAAVTIPFFLTKKNMRFAPILLLPLVTPFLLMGDGNFFSFFKSLKTFSEAYAFNGSVHGIFRYYFNDISFSTALSKIFLGLSLLSGFMLFHPDFKKVQENTPVAGVFFALGAILIFSPTVHFWYLSWVMVLLPFLPMKSWLLLSFTAGISFITEGNQHLTGVWEMPTWAGFFQWLPFYLLFFMEISLFFKRKRNGDPLHKGDVPTSVSVVIPTKNEAVHIAATLDVVFSDHAVSEVIVVDAESSDNTAAIAREKGADVMVCQFSPENGGGRGGQIAMGVGKATGDIIAILHGDVRVKPLAFSGMLALLQKDPSVIGGAIGGVFDHRGYRFRLLEGLNDIRVLLWGISFGDQIQFFRREPVVKANLFPVMPLMEDVEFSIRLKKYGRVAYLFGNATISSRRWVKKGFHNSLFIISKVLLYLWERRKGLPDTIKIYNAYYLNKKD